VNTGNDNVLHGSGRISYNEEFSFDHGNVIPVTVIDCLIKFFLH